MSTTDDVFRSLAIAGSSVLTLCIYPQISKVYRKKSGKTLSLKFLIFVILGLTLLVTYGYYFKLWELAIPITLQASLYFVLLVMKFYYKDGEPENNEESDIP